MTRIHIGKKQFQKWYGVSVTAINVPTCTERKKIYLFLGSEQRSTIIYSGRITLDSLHPEKLRPARPGCGGPAEYPWA